MRSIGNILIANSRDELIDEFVVLFIDAHTSAIEAGGRFAISLSGGSTPKAIYERLVSADVAWADVFFFFGDERCVPPDDTESNFRMANEAMLAPLAIAPDHIFRWQTELGDPPAIASDYASRIFDFFGGTPRFDLCLLGLGPDAHTASLFPGTAALGETERIAVANRVEKFGTFRLTLTPHVINNSADILFVATGSEKADALHAVVDGEFRPETYPAQLIRPTRGRLRWLVDEAAAGDLRAE